MEDNLSERAETKKIIEYSMTISGWRQCSKAHEMLTTCHNYSDEWSISKLNRWIGYAHCLLVAQGTITIDELREKIRRINES